MASDAQLSAKLLERENMKQEKRQQLIDSLEQMIDEVGLEGLLDIIGLVCSEKADHIEQSYNDFGLAESWNRRAAALIYAIDLVHNIERQALELH